MKSKDTIMEKKLTEVQNKHQEDKFLEGGGEASDIKKYIQTGLSHLKDKQ